MGRKGAPQYLFASVQGFQEIPFKGQEDSTMTSILVAMALFTAWGGNCASQKAGQGTNIEQKEVSLNRTNDGQKILVKVGQPVVVTLQTIGGGNYDTPHVSSGAVRFESARYAHPKVQNPGGPRQVYRFTAAAEGEAEIRIPHTGSNPTVTFTIQVKKR
jgi:hypothetical protein